MKKIFMLLSLMAASFGLITTPIYAAEAAPVDEPITERMVDDEEVADDEDEGTVDDEDEGTVDDEDEGAVDGEDEDEDEPTLEDEEKLFQAELSATIAEVFAWIGGFSGLGSLLLFVLRFIRERGVLKAIRDEVKKAKETGDDSAAAVNDLVRAVEAYSKREQAMEKTVIGLIQVSDLHPEAKRQIIEGLQDDLITVEDVFAAGLIQVDAEIEQNAQMKAKIEQTTTSLLSKLAEKDEA